jgi:hypothetical protein
VQRFIAAEENVVVDGLARYTRYTRGAHAATGEEGAEGAMGQRGDKKNRHVDEKEAEKGQKVCLLYSL